MAIELKSPQEIEIMKEGGRILKAVLNKVSTEVKPGITTKELDQYAEKLILEAGAKPSFKGYQGYPAALCTSVNEEVVHAIPGDRILEEGDIISLDLGVYYQGFNTDKALTVPVGKISKELAHLISITEQALARSIKKMRVGAPLGHVSNSIQKFVESEGYYVVRDLVGHGIGREPHEEPAVPNFGPKENGPIMETGLVIAIEPMVNIGGSEVQIDHANWRVVTKDGLPSAHFENTICLTANGAEVIT